ncbi:hypothetical protein [Polluticoccus soli]|uniref:hypothetical protein n=1 Tax=Polluticoccus soli TaxID=3034150 RepID=UPI0023E0EC50|nr:hypothetical protein [Flavipsychrobacter sp. JY13-12]
MNVALWTVIVLASYAKAENKINFPSNHETGLFIGFLFIHGLFIVFIKHSQLKSLSRMRNIATFVCEKNEEENITWEGIEKYHWSWNWSWELITFVITFVLLWAYSFVKVSGIPN